ARPASRIGVVGTPAGGRGLVHHPRPGGPAVSSGLTRHGPRRLWGPYLWPGRGRQYPVGWGDALPPGKHRPRRGAAGDRHGAGIAVEAGWGRGAVKLVSGGSGTGRPKPLRRHSRGGGGTARDASAG